MSLTVEALAKEIRQIDENYGAGDQLATALLPFIERHIAAAAQSPGDSLSLHGTAGRSVSRAAECPCKLATCVEPWEPGCGLGTSAAHVSVAEPKPAGAMPEDIAEIASDEGPLACAELHLRMTTLGCPDVDDGSLADGLRDARRDLKAYGDAREAAGRAVAVNPASSAIEYHNAVGPIDAMAAAFSAMDNNDTELEEWPQRAIDALAFAGWAVVPYALPYEVLGEAGISGVFETGNPKHGWDWLVAKTRIGPHGPPAPIPQQPEAEGDDIAVDRFAEAMKAKMAAARAKGRGGWEVPTCNAEILSRMLRDHVEKGDPRDVANFCMFLWNRGESIATQTASAPMVTRSIAEAVLDEYVRIQTDEHTEHTGADARVDAMYRALTTAMKTATPEMTEDRVIAAAKAISVVRQGTDRAFRMYLDDARAALAAALTEPKS